MSLATQLQSLATRIATEFKTVYGKLGDLTTLNTSAKNSLVAAINEIEAASGAGVAINDSAASTSSVYSSSKTNTAIAAAVASLVNSSPTALDTLKELADALGDDANFSTSIATALGLRVRVDAAQTFTSGQLTQGQANLGVYSTAQVGDPTTDFVATFVAGLS